MASTDSSIPFVYRLFFTYLEPVLATGGAIQTLVQPAEYLSAMAHRAQTNNTPIYDPRTHFVFTSLTGAWLCFAYTEAVILRLYPDDITLWKRLIVGMLLSDVFFCHSAALAVGGYRELVDLANYTAQDWLVCVTTWPFVMARVAFLLGLGLSSAKSKRSSRID